MPAFSDRYRSRLDAVRYRLAGRLRHQEPGGIRFGPRLPTPPLAYRDVSAALEFLRPADLAGDGKGPSEAFAHHRAELEARRSSDDLAEQVASTPWYHTIALPGGVVTPGVYDHRPLVADYGLPARLDGKRVLDVATFDGFWAFELERRGGEVTALDLGTTLDIDLPPAAGDRAEIEKIGVPVGIGFGIAARALGSHVARREGSVYELDPAAWGTFDFVHVGDLLLHLERPLEALRHVRSVATGVAHCSEAFDPSLPGGGVRYLGGWNDVEWWVPSLDTLCQWFIDAGFAGVDVVRTYQINARHSTGGFWRAILRARV